MVRGAETAGGTIGFLYGINVLGAAAGALATPWVFIRHHGMRAALLGRGGREPRRRPVRAGPGARARTERQARAEGADAGGAETTPRDERRAAVRDAGSPSTR